MTPDQHRFGDQGHAEAVPDAVADLPGQPDQVVASGPATVGDRQGVLAGQRGRRGPETLAEAGRLDQPGGAGLDRAARLGEARGAFRQPVRLLGGKDRVGEERPGAPGVVVGLVQHHALAPAQRQHGLADVGHRGPCSGVDVQPAGEFGVLTGIDIRPWRNWKVTLSTT